MESSKRSRKILTPAASTPENYYHPGDLERQIEAFVGHYNHLRYHESIADLTPANVNFGRGQTILLERERIKQQTIKTRRAAITAARPLSMEQQMRQIPH